MPELSILNSTSLEGNYLKDTLSKYLPAFKIEIRDIKRIIPPQRNYARSLAEARFLNRGKELSALVKENIMDIELKLLKKAKTLNGVVYHGFKYREILQDLFPSGEKEFRVVLTDRLLATPEIEGGPPHVRVVLMGYPGVVSTRGVVKGPARDRNLKNKATKNNYIESLSDKRLRDIITGYIMQTLFYFFLGETFCDKKECRLYNAHWQKDMLRAQLEKPAFCKRHAKMLEYITD
ncbi:MAG: DUF6775 family putative metallopeptidase [Elusimicrobiota bacterium]